MCLVILRAEALFNQKVKLLNRYLSVVIDNPNVFMIDLLLFCMVYTSYYFAHVLCRDAWVFSVHLEILVMLLKFNYNLLCSCCIMMSGLVIVSYVGDMLCMSYLTNRQ